jgi:hypothetical protein
MSELDDVVLDRVTVGALLERLPEEPRLVLSLTFGIEYPADWPWPESRWPPIHSEVGWYVGNRLRGRPISEATVRYIRANALQELQQILSKPLQTGAKRRIHVRKGLKST